MTLSGPARYQTSRDSLHVAHTERAQFTIATHSKAHVVNSKAKNMICAHACRNTKSSVVCLQSDLRSRTELIAGIGVPDDAGEDECIHLCVVDAEEEGHVHSDRRGRGTWHATEGDHLNGSC